MTRWWTGPWWKIFGTLRFWFLLYLIGAPLAFIVQIVLGLFLEALTLILFWGIAYATYIYWRQWTENVQELPVRLTYGLLTLVAWIFGGAAVWQLILRRMSLGQASVSLLIGGAHFYMAKLFHERVRRQEPVEGIVDHLQRVYRRLINGTGARVREPSSPGT